MDLKCTTCAILDNKCVKDEHRTRNAAMFGTFHHENLKNSNNMFTAWQFQWKLTAAGSHETKRWEIKQKRGKSCERFPSTAGIFTLQVHRERRRRTIHKELHFVQHYGHEYFTCSVGETCWIVICIGQNYNESLPLPSRPMRKLKKVCKLFMQTPWALSKVNSKRREQFKGVQFLHKFQDYAKMYYCTMHGMTNYTE